VVHKAKNAHRALAFCAHKPGQQALAQLELPGLSAGAAEGPVQIDAVGDDGHGRNARSAPTIFCRRTPKCRPPCSRACRRRSPMRRCCRWVPVGELKMAVRSHGVASNVSGRVILPTRISKRRAGALVASAERSAVLVDHLVGQADGLVNLAAREIRRCTQAGIAHHVQIGLSGQPQRLRDAAPSGVSKSTIRSVL